MLNADIRKTFGKAANVDIGRDELVLEGLEAVDKPNIVKPNTMCMYDKNILSPGNLIVLILKGYLLYIVMQGYIQVQM